MVTTNLRFPEKELHKALLASAKKNKRSMNAEILIAIEYYLANIQKEEKPKETK